jgi:hypothetical protein
LGQIEDEDEDEEEGQRVKVSQTGSNQFEARIEAQGAGLEGAVKLRQTLGF